jgi:hypothetical protein
MADEAKLKYLDSDFQIIKDGAYVVCAVSGEKIPLRQLRYWSVDRQEAYAHAAYALQREQELKK